MAIQSGLIAKKTRNPWPAIVGTALAAFLAAMAAFGNHSTVPPSRDDLPDTGLAIERRFRHVEDELKNQGIEQAKQGVEIRAIKEDTRYTRDRIDRLLELKGSK